VPENPETGRRHRSAAAGVRYVGTRELAVNTSDGMNLLPESMVDLRGKSKFARLPKSTSRWKNLVGYEIESGAACLSKPEHHCHRE